MDYRISDDGQLLRESLRRYLHGRMPPPAELVDRRETWKDLAAAGWLEAYSTTLRDGRPAARVEALHAVEAFGEVPVPGPVSVVAGFVMPLIDGLEEIDIQDDVRGGWVLTAVLPRLTGAGLAARWTYGGLEVTVRRGPGGLVADGVVDRVPGAEQADAVMVPARQDDRTVLLIVPLHGPGVEVTTAPGLDLRHGAARVHLAAAPVTAVGGADDDVDPRVHAAAAGFSLFLDAEAVGGACEVTRRTIAYVGDRQQFGRPVGSFQAVRHKVADMAVAGETARALAYRAAWDLAAGHPGALADLMASRLHASAAYVRVCESAIQCHGGMGFTWEQGLHVWYRAALAGRGLLSDPPGLRRSLAGHLQSLAGP